LTPDANDGCIVCDSVFDVADVAAALAARLWAAAAAAAKIYDTYEKSINNNLDTCSCAVMHTTRILVLVFQSFWWCLKNVMSMLFTGLAFAPDFNIIF